MVNPVFDPDLGSKVEKSKLLVVGAGGIGCELLKNLVLTGFKNITVVNFSKLEFRFFSLSQLEICNFSSISIPLT